MRFLFLLSFILSLAVVNSYSSDGSARSSIAVVDVKLIFRSHPSTDKIRTSLEDKRAKSYKEVQKKREEILSLEKEFELKKSSLSENDFRQLLVKIESEKEVLRKFILDENRELKRYEKELKKPLLREIFAIIDKVRVKRGYLLVMHKEDVVSFDSSIDLTYDVISILKEGS